MIKIDNVDGHGLAVIATERLDPGLSGLKIFAEKALIVFPPMGTEKQFPGPVPKFLDPCPEVFVDWHTYLQKPKSVKDRVLNFYSEMNCRE